MLRDRNGRFMRLPKVGQFATAGHLRGRVVASEVLDGIPVVDLSTADEGLLRSIPVDSLN